MMVVFFFFISSACIICFVLRVFVRFVRVLYTCKSFNGSWHNCSCVCVFFYFYFCVWGTRATETERGIPMSINIHMCVYICECVYSKERGNDNWLLSIIKVMVCLRCVCSNYIHIHKWTDTHMWLWGGIELLF